MKVYLNFASIVEFWITSLMNAIFKLQCATELMSRIWYTFMKNGHVLTMKLCFLCLTFGIWINHLQPVMPLPTLSYAWPSKLKPTLSSHLMTYAQFSKKKKDSSFSTSTNMQEKYFDNANRLHTEVQELIHIFQILELINFATFFKQLVLQR